MADRSQSALREVRDQLFLDTADGHRLDAVTANRGFPRPSGAFEDDTWRAIAKVAQLRAKVGRYVFRRVLEVCVGPQFGRAGNLATASAIGDSEVFAADGSIFVQRGTLRIDPGLSVEEVVTFGYRNEVTGEFCLDSALKFPHRVIAAGSTRLRSDAAVAATSLDVYQADALPEQDYPYSTLLQGGTENEEVVVVLGNDGANTLTVLPLARAHPGPVSQFWKQDLTHAADAGRMFLRFPPGSTRTIPSTGWLRLNLGGGSEESVEYDGNAAALGIVSLVRPLDNSHAQGEPVDFVTPGSRIETASLLQEGVYWDIFNAEANKTTIYLPSESVSARLLDASYLHDAVPPVLAGTTLAVAASADAKTLALASAAGFVQEAGLIQVGNGPKFFYFEVDEDATPNPLLYLPEGIPSSYPAGTPVTQFEVPYSDAPHLEDGNLYDPITGTDLEDRFPGPYVYEPLMDAPGSEVTRLQTNVAPRMSILADQVAGRTALEVSDASLWTVGRIARVGRATGFAEDLAVQAVVLRRSVANTTVTGAHSQGATTLTVGDSSEFPEQSGAGPAGYRIRVDGADVVRVRENDAATEFILESGLPNALTGGETVELLEDVVVFATAFAQPHEYGDPVEELISELTVARGNDFDAGGGKAWLNFGWERTPARRKLASKPSSTIYELETPPEKITEVKATTIIGDITMTVDSSVHFPHGGDGVHELRRRVVIDPGGAAQEVAWLLSNDPETGTLEFTAPLQIGHAIDETVRLIEDDFPTENYPYQVFLHAGGGGEEPVSVTAYDPVLDRLTFAVAPVDTHAVGVSVEFRPGIPQVVEFSSRSGNTLALPEPLVLESGHEAGEAIEQSAGESIPSADGTTWQFWLPAVPGFCFMEIVERLRAAGVVVETTTQR